MKSIVLLSGGMDSATAYHWAMEHTEVVGQLFFDYGQKGAHLEIHAANRISDGTVHRVQIYYPPSIRSSILYNDEVERSGVPDSFVPGRNLTMLSIAGGAAYELGADMIVGGWNQVDVDYPDCTATFLSIAREAVCESLGVEFGKIMVYSPVLYMSKTMIVQFGGIYNVPWEHTRSCYGDDPTPCLSCDSCVKRVSAFLEAGVRDPTVPDRQWDKIDEILEEAAQ